MNRNDFIYLIGNTAPVDRKMLGEVYEIVDIFPYFQSAHLLLLKGLKDNSDVRFENQLRNSALQIADREVLYYLIKNQPVQAPENSCQGKVEDIIPVDVKGSEPVNVFSNISDTHQTVIETARNSDYLISEIEKSEEETLPNEATATEPAIHGHSILVSSDNDSIETAGVIEIRDEEVSGGSDHVFYMDPGIAVSDENDLLELDLGEQDMTITQEDKPDMKQEESSAFGNRFNLQSELIDKFIIANPRIEPVREKQNLPVEDISKPYVEENGAFITETLARIYVRQGYYSKAIDIYEKLSLKFPEKSSYFASQIEKVKEYIKK